MLKLDPVYANPNGVSLRFDLLHPNSRVPAPLVVFIHGGGWISGSKDDLRMVAEEFVIEGFAAALVEYRLAPLHPFPAAVEDVQEFVRYARIHSDELGIDPNRIASFGSSAGAHLAVMLGVTDAPVNGTSSRVQAVVDFSGLTDLTDYRDKHFPISWSFIEQFMHEPYEGNEDAFRLASPAALADANSAPTLIVHGEADDVVAISQSETLAAALASHGVPHRFIRVPSEGHGFTMDTWPSLETAAKNFLMEHL